MEVLRRLKERPFVFVSSVARIKFRSIIYSIEVLKSTALAPNSTEPILYRKNVIELYDYVLGVKNSLIDDASFTRPYIYTGIISSIDAVTSVISVNQPEAIFRMLNRLLTIKMELKLLLSQLRN